VGRIVNPSYVKQAEGGHHAATLEALIARLTAEPGPCKPEATPSFEDARSPVLFVMYGILKQVTLSGPGARAARRAPPDHQQQGEPALSGHGDENVLISAHTTSITVRG
jgi:hypothetical protein